jgi:membrane-associated phospholipid phosphatase
MPVARAAEWINLLFFCLVGGIALMVPLQRTRRVAILLIGGFGVALVVAAQFLGRFLSPLAASVVRDWLPAPMILLAYHQGGQFFSQPRESLQSGLLRFDRWLLTFLGRSLGMSEVPRLVRVYFETAYFFCYPLVPMGVGVLYVTHMRGHTDEFWAIVLPPTYLCYAMIPFLPTLPPWALNGNQDARGGADGVRAVNFFILRHLSIKANTFPSAHVAASIATALALLDFVPIAGLIFLWIAISIAISTVTGRYHYALDAVAGAALAVATFMLTKSL